MLNPKDLSIILQIIKHCERISDKLCFLNQNEFNDNQDIREIICFNLFQIGELAKKLSDEFIRNYNGVPWKYIRSMRDKIVHGYDTINLDIVWETVTLSIDELATYCRKLIE